MSNSIPCIIMRGGTSRGPFLRMRDLPDSEAARADLLLGLMGSGHLLQIDGIGGGNPLTSKVAIVERSTHPDADVDYLFAQVDVLKRHVDFNPNCGNMLSAVGPYAIETGLVEADEGITSVRVRNLNTQRFIECQVSTPNKQVCYEGDVSISGVPGSAAGIRLSFLDVVGAKTGHLLPTGNTVDVIDGVEVSCIDAATPVVLVEANALGVQGNETAEQLDANRDMLDRLEEIRRQAGRLMGMGDVTQSVLPKPIIVSCSDAPACTLRARYFVPHSCHKSIAVTGAIALASAISVEGTLANRVAVKAGHLGPGDLLQSVSIEHPLGVMELDVSHGGGGSGDVSRVSMIRTARKIMSGDIFYPALSA
ncbi:4-oxalomesaconate tautomerase [Halomonas salipaludis]|uniref:4-oxalomesaconate tautomerase n=1 Tax=Halomonas salipaludis TaxID=2032625 RepID=A0A2A2EP59_9GAMM|nr:4-oxalomesaconate tautomerase [Halomonas salipaludis]PAU74284.1 4-oxalomesaconate tautomerase [Halomonas salipaludis]